MKLCLFDDTDQLVWHYNESGGYTVKSGYWLATHSNKSIRLLEIFTSSNFLPIRKQFTMTPCYKYNKVPPLLPRGNNNSSVFFFFCCIYAQCWASGFPNTLLQQPQTDLETNLKSFSNKVLGCWIIYNTYPPWWTLCRIWKTRIKLMFQQTLYSLEDNTQCSLFCILFWCKGMDSCNKLHKTRQTSSISDDRSNKKKWIRPMTGYVKCNYDGSFVNLQTPT